MPFKKGTSGNPIGRPVGSMSSSTKFICDRKTNWNISESTDKQLARKLLSLQKNKYMSEEQNKNTEVMLEIIKRQNIHLSRISKNVQFFFWFFIISILLTLGFSILGISSIL